MLFAKTATMVSIFEMFVLLTWPFIRLFSGQWDYRRIRHFFAQRGVRVLAIQWSPFSAGWLSNWCDRFYLVEYETRRGDSGIITCRTSWHTGVIISDDEEEFAKSDGSAP